MRLNDEQQAIDEVMLYKRAGGNSIVDVTNWGAGRDPEALARLSRTTGLNVIMGSGYYLAGSHPRSMGEKTGETITGEIVKEFSNGAGNTGVFPGLIGEIGCSWPLTDNERKSLIASVKAQQLTGAALSVHPGRKNNESALEIMRILQRSGAEMSRVIMCHIDVRVRDHKERCRIGKTGCYLEYDVFGWEGLAPLSLYQNSDIDVPNDVQRIYEIKSLIDEGFLKQILISQDICYKTWRASYGGQGYSHIMNYIVPLMKRKGITEDQIRTIMIENPKRILTLN